MLRDAPWWARLILWVVAMLCGTWLLITAAAITDDWLTRRRYERQWKYGSHLGAR